MNNHGYYEMKINTSLLDVKGSSSSHMRNSVEFGHVRLVTDY